MKAVFLGDDAGSAEDPNFAIAEMVRRGVIPNVSAMVRGAAFEHAVPILKGLNAGLVALGLKDKAAVVWNGKEADQGEPKPITLGAVAARRNG